MTNKMKELLTWRESKGIKVKFVTEKELADFAGMNPEAAKKFGYKGIKKDELLIDVTLPEDIQFKNLIHELVENELIADGDPYWEAHTKALKAEAWAAEKAEKFVSRRKGKAPIKRVCINIGRSK
jgi:hypothetical protein